MNLVESHYFANSLVAIMTLLAITNYHMAHMLNDSFHNICWTVVSTLALTMSNSVYLISTKDARCV
jgi:hypothetical protein